MPVLLPVKSTLIKVLAVPAVASIAPPALLEMLFEKVELFAAKFAPGPTRTAPPLPSTPFALLLVTIELFITRLAPITKIAPPLSAKPFVNFIALTIKFPLFTLNILPLAFPSTVVVDEPLPTIVSVLFIVISPKSKTTLVTLESKLIVAPEAAAAI